MTMVGNLREGTDCIFVQVFFHEPHPACELYDEKQFTTIHHSTHNTQQFYATAKDIDKNIQNTSVNARE